MRTTRLGPVGCVVIAAAAAPVLLHARNPAVGVASVPAVHAQADVEQVWLRDCAVCHGADALGTGRGPSLAGSGRAFTHYMLTTGRMPIGDPDEKIERRRPAYPSAMVAALVDHVAELAPGGPDIPEVDATAGDVAEGGRLYRGQCAACHAWSAEGGALLEREAPPLGPSTPVQIAEAIRIGPGTMPAFGAAALSDEDVASVIAYVRYLDDPRDVGGQPLWHLGPLAEGAVAWVAGIGFLLFALRRIGTDR